MNETLTWDLGLGDLTWGMGNQSDLVTWCLHIEIYVHMKFIVHSHKQPQ